MGSHASASVAASGVSKAIHRAIPTNPTAAPTAAEPQGFRGPVRGGYQRQPHHSRAGTSVRRRP